MGQPAASQGPALFTADGRPIELSISEQHLRALDQVLKPGSTISGRVIERFADDAYLVNLRGRNLIASSNMPLLRDSVVRFAVLESADGLRLRLEGVNPQDRAQTSQPHQRLAALGMADTPQNRLVLQAFEEASAPLSPATRLEQASTALHQARQLPPAQQMQLAASHALLAQLRLPATPALLSLADHALRGQVPNVAADLQRLSQGLPQSDEAARLPHPMGSEARAQGSLPTNISQGMAQAATSRPSAATLPEAPAQPAQPAGQTAQPAPASPSGLQNTAAAPAEQAASPPSRLEGLPGGDTSRSAPATGQAADNRAVPPPAVTAPLAELNRGPAQHPQSGLQALMRDLDLEQGTPLALARSLRQAGIRIAAEGETTAAKTGAADSNAMIQEKGPNIAREMGAGPSRLPPEAAVRGGESADDIQSLRELLPLLRNLAQESPEMRSGLQHAARELLADTLLPPRSLADFDLVVPLLLFHQQQPQPARLAVSTRVNSGTQATFLRVDIELSRLGPLSLRMSESTALPMSISIFHTPQAASALQAGYQDLCEDLRQQGLDAHLRLVDMSEEI